MAVAALAAAGAKIGALQSEPASLQGASRPPGGMVFDCKGHLFSPLIPLALGRSPRVVPRRLYELLSKMGVAGFDNAARGSPSLRWNARKE